VSRYQKGKTNLDFTEARDSEWQWHQLGHMQVSTSLQANNHASTPLLSFLPLPVAQPTASKHSIQQNINNRRGGRDSRPNGQLKYAICRTEVFIKTAVQISINILTNSKKICLPSFNGDCQQRK